jgi:hypothetical protein
MKAPLVPYTLIGLFVGTTLNFILTGGSTRESDLLTGAIFGIVLGLGLAIAKYILLGGK